MILLATSYYEWCIRNAPPRTSCLELPPVDQEKKQSVDSVSSGSMALRRPFPRLPSMALWEWDVTQDDFLDGSQCEAVLQIIIGAQQRPARPATGTKTALGWPWCLLSDDDCEALRSKMRKAYRDERHAWWSLELCFERPNGEIRNLRIAMQRAASSDNHFTGLLQDITEDWRQKQSMEHQLRRWQEAGLLVMDGWCVYDLTNRIITEMSQSLPKIFGRNQFWCNCVLNDLVNEVDLQRAQGLIMSALERGSSHAEFQMTHPGGSGCGFVADVYVLSTQDDPSCHTMVLKRKNETGKSSAGTPDQQGEKPKTVSETKIEAPVLPQADASDIDASIKSSWSDLSSEDSVRRGKVRHNIVACEKQTAGTISEIMQLSTTDSSAVLMQVKKCNTNMGKVPSGWLFLPPCTSMDRLEPPVRSAALAVLPAKAAQYLDAGDWAAISQFAFQCLLRQIGATLETDDRSGSPVLPSIAEDDAADEPLDVPQIFSADVGTLFSITHLLGHAVLRLVVEKVSSTKVLNAEMNAARVNLRSSLPKAMKYLRQAVKMLHRLAGDHDGGRATLRGPVFLRKSKPLCIRILRFLTMNAWNVVLWSAMHEPDGIAYEDVRDIHDEILNFTLEKSMMMRSYISCAQFAGYLMAAGRSDEALQELDEVRQQLLLTKDGRRSELILPMICYNLALGQQSMVGANAFCNGFESASALRWKALQRLEQIRPPLQTWSEELCNMLATNNVSGKIGSFLTL